MKAHVRIREQAIGGTPEVYVGDPDGIVIQLNDSSYGGGLAAPETSIPGRRSRPQPTGCWQSETTTMSHRLCPINDALSGSIRSCSKCRLIPIKDLCQFFVWGRVTNPLRLLALPTVNPPRLSITCALQWTISIPAGFSRHSQATGLRPAPTNAAAPRH